MRREERGYLRECHGIFMADHFHKPGAIGYSGKDIGWRRWFRGLEYVGRKVIVGGISENDGLAGGRVDKWMYVSASSACVVHVYINTVQ